MTYQSNCLPSLAASSRWISVSTGWSAWWSTIAVRLASISSGQTFVLMLMFGSVDWVVMDWNSDNMGLHNEWIRNLHWNMDWEWNLNFLDDWNFNLLVDWILLDMMMMNGMDMVWNRDFNMFAAIKVKAWVLICTTSLFGKQENCQVSFAS